MAAAGAGAGADAAAAGAGAGADAGASSYAAPAMKSVAEMQALDSADESLNRWKAQLLSGAADGAAASLCPRSGAPPSVDNRPSFSPRSRASHAVSPHPNALFMGMKGPFISSRVGGGCYRL